MVDIPAAVTEVEGEGDEKFDGAREKEVGGVKKGGEDDQVGRAAAGKTGGGGEQTNWEREMKAKEAGLGRKWTEGGDNESLFCY